MAVDFLNEIYQESNMIFELKKMQKMCLRGQSRLLINAWQDQAQSIASFCQKTAELNNALGLSIWNDITSLPSLIEKYDFSAIADALEQLIPHFYEAMALRGQIDVSEGQYKLFSSKSGFLCLEDTALCKISSSTVDPAFEAYEKALALCETAKTDFCEIGCSLGYLPWQMFEVSDQVMDIYIYETDKIRIDYAFEYGVLDRIPEDRLHIFIDSDINKLVKEITKNHLDKDREDYTAFYIDPELENALSDNNPLLASAISDKICTTVNFLDNVERNFYSNYRNVNKFITQLNQDALCKNWIVVGGGPSLDYNLDFIKENSDSFTIIAATTAVKRLISEGIKPDFMIAIDMQKRTFKHLEGLEDMNIPLIMSDCASWKFGKLYKGEKYLIPTSGMLFSADLYKARGIECWSICGTVTAVAMEVAARSGASKIDLVGLDLSYPEKKSHASGTMDQAQIDTDGLVQVPSVDGKTVYTSPVFISYIREVEGIISNYPKVSFYNRSRNGAYIQGCLTIHRP